MDGSGRRVTVVEGRDPQACAEGLLSRDPVAVVDQVQPGEVCRDQTGVDGGAVLRVWVSSRFSLVR